MKTMKIHSKYLNQDFTFNVRNQFRENFSLDSYLKEILKRQRLDMWKYDPKKFDKWIKKVLRDRISSLTFSIS